jgi:hypothetical protein
MVLSYRGRVLDLSLKPFESVQDAAGMWKGNRTRGRQTGGNHVLGAMAIKCSPGKRLAHNRLYCRNTGTAGQ